MKRREVLLSAGAAAGAGLGLQAPAIARGIRELIMVTDWPEGPGILASARRLARAVAEASEGRIRIKVTASGEVVRPFETFDAVQSGVADMFHTHIGYFESKSRALHFFSGVPFGLTSDELFAWLHHGDGQALWDELGAAFNIKPLLAASTGPQMGGWFLDEIHTTSDLEGLRYRMAGPGAEVFRRLGATVVLLPGADIVQSLRSGAIQACEWIGPWLDTEMGLHRVADYYYYPSWHEPCAALALGINRKVWNDFDSGEQRLIETAAASEYANSLAEFSTNNARALAMLRTDDRIQIRQFTGVMLRTFREISEQVLAESGGVDELSRRIYRSYTEFRELIGDWSTIAVGAYLDARGID